MITKENTSIQISNKKELSFITGLLFLACFLFCYSPTLHSYDNILQLTDEAEKISAIPYISSFEDPSRRLTLDQVSSPKYQAKFKVRTRNIVNFGRTNSAIWIHFTFKNNSWKKWYMVMDALLGDELDLYIFPSYLGVKPRATLRYAERLASYRVPAWGLDLPSGEQFDVYIRATNGKAILNIPVDFLPADAMVRKTSTDYMLNTAIYISMLVFALYNLFLYFTFKHYSYLTLLAFIIAIVGLYHRANPVFEPFYFLSNTNSHFYTTPVLVAFGSFILFSRQILRTRLHLPKTDDFLKKAGLISMFLIPIIGFIPNDFIIPSGMGVPAIIGLIIVPVLVYASYKMSVRKELLAKYYFISFLVVAILGSIHSLKQFIDPQEWNTHQDIPMAVMTVFFTFMLSYIQTKRTRHFRDRMLKAKAENKSKSEFLSSMSHELRTPMHSIIAIATLLKLEKLTDKQNDYVSKLEVSARYMMKLIGDILNLEKIRSKKYHKRKEPFTLDRIIKSVSNIVEKQASQKDICFTVKPDKVFDETLIGDTTRLTQILINLIGNGIKYTNHGKVTLSITHQLLGQHRCKIKFSIEDTGIGIPKERHPHLFEAFNQIDQYYEGFGLGLIISHNLVETLGGKLEFYSEEDKGSCFYFSLSFDIQPSESNSALEKISAETMLPKGVRILLVDDCEMNRFIGRELVQSIGGNVALASDGKNAILQFQQYDFDLVLMDISMPEMDGFEVTQWIRENGQHPNIPIIALTAHATPTIEEKCKHAGMSDYLAKPFDREAIYRVIRKWI